MAAQARRPRRGQVKPPPPHPRTITVYLAQTELEDLVWKFQSDHQLTGAETLLIIGAVQAQLMRHLVFGDPYPR